MKRKTLNTKRERKAPTRFRGRKQASKKPTRGTSARRAKGLTGAEAKKRILLVDDDPQSLELLSALLDAAGFQVTRAENALAAICAVVRAVPDLVLADIRMPIVDGKDLVRELRSHRDTQDVPVVALTGYDSPEMKKSALAAGYNAYMTKPIHPGRFEIEIRKILRKHELNQRTKAFRIGRGHVIHEK